MMFFRLHSIVFFLLLLNLTAFIVAEELQTSDEFYARCEDDQISSEPVREITPADYSCLIDISANIKAIDIVIDLTSNQVGGSSYVPGAHKLPFDHLLHKSWMKNKSSLLLDDGLSSIEAARKCYRLRKAGLEKVWIVIGGIRAYLYNAGSIEAEEMDIVSPNKILGALEQGRVRLLLINQFVHPSEKVFDVSAVFSEIQNLAPTFEAEQFMPVLLVGDRKNYDLLKSRYRRLPWWVYYLDGGEQAYMRQLQQQRAIVANQSVKLRKCGAI